MTTAIRTRFSFQIEAKGRAALRAVRPFMSSAVRQMTPLLGGSLVARRVLSLARDLNRGPWRPYRGRPARSPPSAPNRRNGNRPSSPAYSRPAARHNAAPSVSNSFATMASSRIRAKASRRACRSPRLASVISRSATRRRSFALGSVVTICSCLISAAARLANNALRCVAVRLSLRPALRWRMMPSITTSGLPAPADQ